MIGDGERVREWDKEGRLGVRWYKGDVGEYRYKVVKREIECEGDVELKRREEVGCFGGRKRRVVKGKVIMGCDGEEGEKMSEICGLGCLKEVSGKIVIGKS